MKQKITYRMALILIAVLAIIPIIQANAAEKGPAKTVAVIPMQMNAAQDLSFLQKGLFSMMSSRLADPGKVDVLDRETIDAALAEAQKTPETKGALNEGKARRIAQKLKADYVMFGSVTMFGNSVSLDTTMVDVSGQTPSLTFSRQAKEPGAVITEMDSIATQVNLKVFDRKQEQFIPQQQFAQAPQQQALGGPRDSYASPLTQYHVMFSTSGEIIGMSYADVNDDKINEIVAAYTQGVEILAKNPEGRFVRIKRLEGQDHMDIVGADAADINRNGTAEIFITRVQRADGYLHSIVLEKGEDGQYKEIAADLPWYLRAVHEEDGRVVLYGQESGRFGPFKGQDVFEVVWNGNTYVRGQKLLVPDGFSVMSMTAGRDIGKGLKERAFTDSKGRLVLFNESGREEWSGDDGYGGSKLFYTFKETDPILQPDSDGKGVFFQPKSIIADIGSDGKTELIVIDNKDAANELFGQIRMFKKGELVVMRWNELGLQSEQAAKQVPGQITDILLSDVDGDGNDELLVSFIKKRNSFNSQKSKTMIIAYEIM